MGAGWVDAALSSEDTFFAQEGRELLGELIDRAQVASGPCVAEVARRFLAMALTGTTKGERARGRFRGTCAGGAATRGLRAEARRWMRGCSDIPADGRSSPLARKWRRRFAVRP